MKDCTAAHRQFDQRGFTLIELLVTVFIMGVLASVALPMYDLVTIRAKEQKLRVALRELRSALDDYKRAADNGRIVLTVGASGYPPSLEALVEGVLDAKSPSGRKIYFLRRIPRDPFFPDGSVPAARTWGLRSYLSEPTEPKPGEDVFDVYSLSKDIAFDGTAYRDW